MAWLTIAIFGTPETFRERFLISNVKTGHMNEYYSEWYLTQGTYSSK